MIVVPIYRNRPGTLLTTKSLILNLPLDCVKYSGIISSFSEAVRVHMLIYFQLLLASERMR